MKEDGTALPVGAGLVGQLKAREAASLVVHLIKTVGVREGAARDATSSLA